MKVTASTGEQGDVTLPAAQAHTVETPRLLGGRYDTQGEIGHGGMGVVLAAHDVVLRRDLAIKMLPDDEQVPDELVARFFAEAHIQGQLQHPNICPIHDLGVDEQGRPFIAMKRVKGRSLDEVLAEVARAEAQGQAHDYPQVRLLDVFLRVCDAVAFAHARGILHRDLKPENVMMGEFGEVLVMDWGVAKVMNRLERQGHPLPCAPVGTQYGSAVGTPGYMPPEQEAGDLDHIDERADVFGLGGILYAILTCKAPRPMDGGYVIVPPSRRAPERHVPLDLEAATMKALAYTPGARYASVAELRSEVAVFLGGGLLKVGRYGLFTLLRKWAHRHPARVVALGGLLAVILVAATVSLLEQGRARDSLQASLRVTERQLAHALLAQGRFLGAAERWPEARDRFVAANDAFDRAGEDNVLARLALLDSYRRSPPPVFTVPTGSPLRTLFLLGTQEAPRLLLNRGKSFVVWDVVRGAEAQRLHVFADEDDGAGIVVAADDRYLLAADEGSVHLLEHATGRRLWDEVKTPGGRDGWFQASALAFSSAAQRALLGDVDGGLHLVDLQTGQELARFAGVGRMQGFVRRVSLSDDGRLGLVNHASGYAVWDLQRGRKLREETGVPGAAVLAVKGGLMVVSRTGKAELGVLDAVTGEVRMRLPLAHPAGTVALSADARWAVTGGRDGVVEVHDISLAADASSLRESHATGLNGASVVAVSTDGRLVAAGGPEGMVRVWAAAAPWKVDSPGRVLDTVSPDGRVGVVVEGFGEAVLFDVATGKRLRAIGSNRGWSSGRFTPDNLLWWGGGPGGLKLWDVAANQARPVPTVDLAMPPLLGGAGRWLVVVEQPNVLAVRDARTGVLQHRFTGAYEFEVVGAAAGAALAVSASKDGLRAWDLAGGQALRAWKDPRQNARIDALAVSNQGHLLASAGWIEERGVNGIRLWDLDRGAELRFLARTVQRVPRMAFLSADRLLAAEDEDSVRVWQVDSGDEVLALEPGTALPLPERLGVPPGRMSLWQMGSPAFAARGFTAPTFDPHLHEGAEYIIDAPGVRRGGVAHWYTNYGAPWEALPAWYAGLGQWAWALGPYQDLATHGYQDFDHLPMARAAWMLGRLDAAEEAFAMAASRKEAPDYYLGLCLEAVRAARRAPQ
jgi:WD40 repeat protein